MSRLRFLGSKFAVAGLVAALAIGCGGTDKKTDGSGSDKKGGGAKAAKEKEGGGAASAKSEKTPIKPTAFATIKGKVTLEGPVPPVANLNFEGNKDKDDCLKGPKEDPTWIVDKDSKGVKNVVIWLRAPAGKFFDLPPDQQKPAKPQVMIHQPFCAFDTLKIGLFDKQTDRSGNEDVILLKCDIHTWMRGYIIALDHPYAAITNDKGEYEIKNVPAGTDLVIVGWHEADQYFLPDKAKGQKIDALKDNETKTLDFTIKK